MPRKIPLQSLQACFTSPDTCRLQLASFGTICTNTDNFMWQDSTPGVLCVLSRAVAVWHTTATLLTLQATSQLTIQKARADQFRCTMSCVAVCHSVIRSPPQEASNSAPCHGALIFLWHMRKTRVLVPCTDSLRHKSCCQINGHSNSDAENMQVE